MQVTIWGARGSIPSPGPSTVRYGGNTPCIGVRGTDGGLLVLDGGTGVRALGSALRREGGREPIEVLITHAHWDHVQGLPFFEPLYQADRRIRMCGAGASAVAVEHAIRSQMDNGAFPVRFQALQASIELQEVAPGAELSGFVVDPFPASHQDGAVGYRVREGNGTGAALVYFPDSELSAPEAHGLAARWREDFTRFIEGAALLVHDAMYTEEEYQAYRGWGHSHMEEVVRMAEEAGVRTLALFHHHPDRSDEALESCLHTCRSALRTSGATEVLAAAEGMTLTL